MTTAIHPHTNPREPRLVRPLGSKAELLQQLESCRHSTGHAASLIERVRATHLALLADAGDARPDMRPDAMGVEQ